jgi:hypothetical protein
MGDDHEIRVQHISHPGHENCRADRQYEDARSPR